MMLRRPFFATLFIAVTSATLFSMHPAARSEPEEFQAASRAILEATQRLNGMFERVLDIHDAIIYGERLMVWVKDPKDPRPKPPFVHGFLRKEFINKLEKKNAEIKKIKLPNVVRATIPRQLETDSSTVRRNKIRSSLSHVSRLFRTLLAHKRLKLALESAERDFKIIPGNELIKMQKASFKCTAVPDPVIKGECRSLFWELRQIGRIQGDIRSELRAKNKFLRGRHLVTAGQVDVHLRFAIESLQIESSALERADPRQLGLLQKIESKTSNIEAAQDRMKDIRNNLNKESDSLRDLHANIDALSRVLKHSRFALFTARRHAKAAQMRSEQAQSNFNSATTDYKAFRYGPCTNVGRDSRACCTGNQHFNVNDCPLTDRVKEFRDEKGDRRVEMDNSRRARDAARAHASNTRNTAQELADRFRIQQSKLRNQKAQSQEISSRIDDLRSELNRQEARLEDLKAQRVQQINHWLQSTARLRRAVKQNTFLLLESLKLKGLLRQLSQF